MLPYFLSQVSDSKSDFKFLSPVSISSGATVENDEIPDLYSSLKYISGRAHPAAAKWSTESRGRGNG